jgi:hypothetical protein
MIEGLFATPGLPSAVGGGDGGRLGLHVVDHGGHQVVADAV